MPSSAFDALSPHDFEQLMQDLVRAEYGVQVESFTAGRDKGIDLRVLSKKDSLQTVIQCKHYAKSGFAKLHARLIEEKSKVEALAPDRYIIATTVPMTPDRKDKLVATLHPWVRSPADIWGAEDLTAMLRANPSVEKANFKLWISSTAVLERVLHNDILTRTEGYIEDLKRKSQIYVQNSSFTKALQLLSDHHVCIISGAPGVGKTTLAEILLLHLMANEYQPVLVSQDISEGDQLYTLDTRQVFIYDDFLGRSSALEKLGKNEDDRLLRFVTRVQQSENKRFILTTREYLLRQARMDYERLGDQRLDISKLMLDVAAYTRIHRAHILYNHLYFSQLTTEALEAVVQARTYRRVIEHANYVPRLVEDAVALASSRSVPAGDFPEFLAQAFERPEELWANVLERQLSSSQQILLIILSSLDLPEALTTLEDCYFAVQRAHQLEPFEDAFRAIEGTAVALRGRKALRPVVDFINPGVQDAVLARLGPRSELLDVAIRSCRTFEQVVTLWAHSKQAIPTATPDYAERPSSMEYVRRFVRRRLQQDLPGRAHVHRAMRQNGQVVVDALTELALSAPRSGIAAEERVGFIVRVSEDLGVEISIAEWSKLEAYLVRRWKEGETGDKDATLDLLNTLVRYREKVPHEVFLRLGDAAIHWFTATRYSTHDYVALKDLRAFLATEQHAFGSSFERLPELNELVDEYSAILESEIDRIYHSSDPAPDLRDALDELEHLAADMGIDGVPQMAAYLHEAIDEWEAEMAVRDSDAYDEWRDRFDDMSGFDDIDDLFDSLAR